MKMKITTVGGAATREDGTLSIGVEDSRGKVHTIEFSSSAQKNLLAALITSAPLDQAAQIPARRFRIAGLRRYRFPQGDLGVSFYLGPNAAIHLEFAQPLVAELQHLLATASDLSSSSDKPN